jgi:hypothetical protein
VRAGPGLRPILNWPVLPWLALAAGLTLATLPAWRPLLFDSPPTIEDLLGLRCRPR